MEYYRSHKNVFIYIVTINFFFSLSYLAHTHANSFHFVESFTTIRDTNTESLNSNIIIFRIL